MTVPTNNEEREALGEVLALVDDYDGCHERVRQWEATEQWEKDAHPDEEPFSDREDAESWNRRADAALAWFAARRLPVSGDNEAGWRKAIAGQVRRNCTPSSEAYVKGGDFLISAVADWIENPPEWVPPLLTVPEPTDVSEGEAERDAVIDQMRRAERAARAVENHFPADVLAQSIWYVEQYFDVQLREIEAAPSDSDREAALRAVVEAARGKMSETEWLIASREPMTAYRVYADAVLAAGFSRTSHPVQVEVTDELQKLRAWKDAASVLLEQITVNGRPALPLVETMTEHTAALGGGKND